MSMCRFCLQVDLVVNMIAPCNCSGTCAFLHKACITQWLEYTDTCNICKTRYKLTTGIPVFSQVIETIGSNLNEFIADILILIIFMLAYLVFSYYALFHVISQKDSITTQLWTYGNVGLGILVLFYTSEGFIDKYGFWRKV